MKYIEEIWDKNWKAELYRPPNHSYYKIFYVNKKNGESRWGKPFDIDGNPLPKGWERVYSNKQKKYYYLNTNTNESQFKNPLLTQNNYSPSYHLDLIKPSLSEIFDGHPYLRTQSDHYVNEDQIPDEEDGHKVYRSRSGNRKYFDHLPARYHEPAERIFIYERCCDDKTQFPSRFCAESFSHQALAHASYVLNTEDKSLDGFVEIRNEKVNEDSPKYDSVEYIKKKDKVKSYGNLFKDSILPTWTRSARPVVQEEHNLSDHDAIILNLHFEISQEEVMQFNIISMNLEGLCKVRKDDPYRYIDYMNSYFDPHIKRGTIMVFQEVVLKDLATTKYTKDVETDDGFVTDTIDVLAVDEAGNAILQILQSANPYIPLTFMSDTYTSGILYDTSVWNISDVREIPRKYRGEFHEKFSNAYLFTSKDNSCEFWVVNIHLKAPFNTAEFTADFKEEISMKVGKLDPSKASNHVSNMHIIELNNIINILTDASLNFEIPVYLCGDYNNEISKGFLVKEAIEVKTD